MNYLSKFTDAIRKIEELRDELNSEEMTSYGVEYYLQEASNHVETARRLFTQNYVKDE